MARKKDVFTDEACKVIARMSMEIACEAYGLSHTELAGPGRGGNFQVLARQTAMYLAHIVGQLTLNETALYFGRDRSTVSYACMNIEDRRDSPVFNLQLEYMENRLRARIDAFRGFDRAPPPPDFEKKSVSNWV